MNDLSTTSPRTNSSQLRTLKPSKSVAPTLREIGLIEPSSHMKASTFSWLAMRRNAKFRSLVEGDPRFADLEFKESWSTASLQPDVIKVKKEIISMGVPEINPAKHEPKYMDARRKRWYEEGKKVSHLDTRNDYEIRIGTFKCRHLDLETFRAFPEAARSIPEEQKTEPMVTFCTGGIRCAKQPAARVSASRKSMSSKAVF